MDQNNKTFDELMKETDEFINKLNSNNISMDEAMKLFEQGIKNLNVAKEKLSENKIQIKKVLDDNKLEDFE